MRWIALFGVALGCGGGAKKTEEPVVAANAAPPDAAPVAEPAPVPTRVSITGAVECDALVVALRCIAMDVFEARKAIQDLLPAYRDALAQEGSRQVTIDACLESMTSIQDQMLAAGCPAPTGAVPCDELVELTVCMARDVPEARRAALDSADAYRAAIANEASRQMTIDACVQTLPDIRDAAPAMGCLP